MNVNTETCLQKNEPEQNTYFLKKRPLITGLELPISKLKLSVNAIEESKTPSIRTLMNILESLIVCGNLRRIEVHRRSSISYAKLIEYIKWLKLKELIVENGSYVSITEKGIILYNYLV